MLKTKPYWFIFATKFSIIIIALAILFFTISFISLVIQYETTDDPYTGLGFIALGIIFFFSFFLILFIIGYFFDIPTVQAIEDLPLVLSIIIYIFSFVITLLVVFAIGSIIGLIIQKIKKKNISKPQSF